MALEQRDEAVATRVAIVTGASSGIGAATARMLASQGMAVAMWARRPEGREVARGITDAGGRAWYVECDVLDEAAVATAFEATEHAFGHVDVLVNNAGGTDTGGYEPNSSSAWRHLLDLNLTSAFMVTSCAWPSLETSLLAPCIVNVSSVVSQLGLSASQRQRSGHVYPAGYAAAKGGLEAYTRFLAGEGAVSGIRVNAVRPGQILTPLTTWRNPGHHSMEPFYEDVQLVSRPGLAEDVATCIAFLCSAGAAFVNGQVLNVDGGAAAKV